MDLQSPFFVVFGRQLEPLSPIIFRQVSAQYIAGIFRNLPYFQLPETTKGNPQTVPLKLGTSDTSGWPTNMAEGLPSVPTEAQDPRSDANNMRTSIRERSGNARRRIVNSPASLHDLFFVKFSKIFFISIDPYMDL